MSWGRIEFATISRLQDVTTIKQNEDNKGSVLQTNVVQTNKKETDQRPKQVNTRDDADWHSKNFDAKEKGNGSYQGDGGQKRQKQQPVEKVIKKSHQGFDVKI